MKHHIDLTHQHQWSSPNCVRTVHAKHDTAMPFLLQWNLSIKDILNKGHLSNEDTVHSPNHIELCTNLPLN